LLATCSAPPSVLEQIAQIGELRVVTRNTPTAFYYGADEPRGIEYELVRGFAEKLGVSLKIFIGEHVHADVASGKAHIAAANLSVADTRKHAIAFGSAYQSIVPQVIYRRGTKRPADVADLHGGRLEIAAGSSHSMLLEKMRADEPLLTWIENDATSTEELVRRVADGEIDYTIADSHEFAVIRHFYPEARAAFTLGEPIDVAWVLPEGADDLRELIAAYFAEIEATGELAAILDRYYAPSRDFDYVGSRAFVRHFEARLPLYRDLFKAAAEATGTDWRLLAAMAYQESHWNPEATSPTGVRGMMMLTERTADMMGVKDRLDAAESIMGGARYFKRVLGKIPERIPEPDRSWLAVAAYNVGFGHLEDARILTESQGGDPDDWTAVRERLPLLSEEEWHRRVPRGYAPGGQAVTYVDNVQQYYELLMWMGSREAVTTSEITIPASTASKGGALAEG